MVGPPIVYRTGVPRLRRTHAVAIKEVPPIVPPQQGQRLLVHLIVPGEPVPKARPRVVRTGAYTAPRTRDQEIRLLGYLKAQYPRLRPDRSLLSVSVECWFKGTRKADVDNLLKLVLDAFNRIVWDDDAQVVEALVRKHANSSLPRTEVHVWALAGER